MPKRKELGSSEVSSWIRELLEMLQLRREESEFRYDEKLCDHCGDEPAYSVVSDDIKKFVCRSCIFPYICNIRDYITKL